MQSYLPVLFLVCMTIFADYLLKLASLRADWFWSWQFAAGAALYAASAIGWVLAMRRLTLAGIGVAYSASTILLLTALGALAFREPISGRDMLGVAFAIAAIALMDRH
jgi:small multidrug resistance pump